MTLKHALYLVAVSALSLQVHASAIFSNVDAGWPADAATVFSTGSGIPFFGTPFTATGSGNLATLEIEAGGLTGTANVTGGLFTNGAGNQPGTLLESWTFDVPIFNPRPPVTVLTSVLTPAFSQGSQYWWVFTSGGSNIEWFSTGDTSATGGIWAGSTLTSLAQSFSNIEPPGLSLATATPEPGTYGMLLAGLLGLIAARLFSTRGRHLSRSS
jgi:hypothetical protein